MLYPFSHPIQHYAITPGLFINHASRPDGRAEVLFLFPPANPSLSSFRQRPHLGEDVGAVPVVTVRLAVVGGEAGASQYGAHGGTVFLCALPLAVFARAACRQWHNQLEGAEDNTKCRADVKATHHSLHSFL